MIRCNGITHYSVLIFDDFSEIKNCSSEMKSLSYHIVSIQVKERPDIGVYVKDLSAYVVNNADDMDRTMTMGNKNSKQLLLFQITCLSFSFHCD